MAKNNSNRNIPARIMNEPANIAVKETLDVFDTELVPVQNTKQVQEVAPVQNTKQTETVAREAMQSIKEQLEAAPLMSIFVPLNPGEEAGNAYLEGGIGGYMWRYPKGVMLSVPEPIFNQIAESLNLTIQALSRNRANRNEYKNGTTVAEALN